MEIEGWGGGDSGKGGGRRGGLGKEGGWFDSVGVVVEEAVCGEGEGVWGVWK